jgi:hypothetical protein
MLPSFQQTVTSFNKFSLLITWRSASWYESGLRGLSLNDWEPLVHKKWQKAWRLCVTNGDAIHARSGSDTVRNKLGYNHRLTECVAIHSTQHTDDISCEINNDADNSLTSLDKLEFTYSESRHYTPQS